MREGRELLSLLQSAHRSVRALPPLEADTVDLLTGYYIQFHGLQQRTAMGEQLTGWKVAFASRAAQTRFGIREPVFGGLTNAMAVEAGSNVPLAQLIQPKLEIELAFVMGQTLLPGEYRDEDILAAMSEIAPAFEIADCRWQDWQFGVGAFLADNAAAALYCLGERVPFDPLQHACLTYSLEHEGKPCGSGNTAEREDMPVINLFWLIRRLLADGHGIEAGQVILSGSLLQPLGILAGEYRLHMLGTELALVFEREP